MTIAGKTIRLKRIFQADGRTFIFALDHGSFMGPVKGSEKPLEILAKVLGAGVDAVMANLGVIKEYAPVLARKHLGWILTVLDKSPTTVLQSLKTASNLGVDAVKYFVKVGGENEREELETLWALSAAAVDFGMPVLAEMFPASISAASAAGIAKISRIGAEYGADFIKTMYPGDVDGFRYVVDTCPVPVVVMGGEFVDSELEVLRMVYDSLSAGGAGVAFGRNIFQHPKPEKVTKAIYGLIHEGLSPEKALPMI
ncbi:MAG: hypothetical protein QXV97_00410 [Candidatus Caldarchaeum sp.]